MLLALRCASPALDVAAVLDALYVKFCCSCCAFAAAHCEQCCWAGSWRWRLGRLGRRWRRQQRWTGAVRLQRCAQWRNSRRLRSPRPHRLRPLLLRRPRLSGVHPVQPLPRHSMDSVRQPTGQHGQACGWWVAERRLSSGLCPGRCWRRRGLMRLPLPTQQAVVVGTGAAAKAALMLRHLPKPALEPAMAAVGLALMLLPRP